MSESRRRAAMWVAVIAVAAAMFLRYETAVHEITGEASGCTFSARVDCDAVQASPYAHVAGYPVSLWGAAGNLVLFLLLLTAARDGGPYLRLAGALAAFNLLAALTFLAISTFVLHTFCVYCSVMQAASVALAALVVPPAFAARWSGGRAPLLRAAILVAAALGLMVTGEAYASARTELLRSFQVPEGATMRIETADALIVGNPDSEDSAVVFFDLLCPHCKRCFHDVVRALAGRDRDFHVVYKHWPLDTDCNQELPSTVHPGACVAATAATAAATRGKAGEAIVYLFDQVAMFPQVVDKLGETIVGMPKDEWRALLRSRRVQRTLARDIAEGNELGLERVPAVFLNGRPVDCARIGALLERLK